MSDHPYYYAYEARYRKVYHAGIERWGHSPKDKVLLETLRFWVNENRLSGKRIIEFACGEGAGGEILAAFGCRYHGIDIAPSAVAKAREALKDYTNASVALMDMVKHPVPRTYDAALDVMGFHMLVLDSDRKKYLGNAFQCLTSGAPMLFFREACRSDAPTAEINAVAEWTAITGDDYKTPQRRTLNQHNEETAVYIPRVPARAKRKDDYITELREAGFIVDDFIEMAPNAQCPCAASIYVHKP